MLVSLWFVFSWVSYLPLFQSVGTRVGIGVIWYKTWSSTVALLSGAVGEAVSLESASMTGMCSSVPVQVSCCQVRTILCAPSQSHAALLEMHAYISPLLLSSPINLDLASPPRLVPEAIDSDIGQRRKGRDRSQQN